MPKASATFAKPGRDVVYVIEIDPTKLSTNFEDWIEKDLLKLNAWDLQQVQVKDYSAELQPVMTQQGLRFQLAGDMRSDLTLAYNDSDAKWNAGTLRQFDTADRTVRRLHTGRRRGAQHRNAERTEDRARRPRRSSTWSASRKG